MNEIPYKKYLAFAVPYGIALSLLYLFGYWGSFKINVLEFIGFDEIAKLALYPLLGSLFFLLTGFASGFMFGRIVPFEGVADPRVGQFWRKHAPLLILLHITIIMLSITFLPATIKWFIVSVLVAFFCVPLNQLNYFIELIPDPRSRVSLLYIFIFAAGLAFSYGNIDAHRAKTGYGQMIVDIERSNLSLGVSESNSVTYLGYIGGYFALYEAATDSLILVKEKGDTPLVLRRNPKRS